MKNPTSKNTAVPTPGTSLLTAPISVTKWTASRPVTKRLALGAGDKIDKVSTAAQLYEGRITRIHCSPSEFVDVLLQIGSNDCLSYAVPKDPIALRVMSRARRAAFGHPSDAMTRTVDEMVWSDGPSILMIDYDPPESGALSKTDLLDALYRLCPTLQHCAHIWAASTSSCLVDTDADREVRGLAGQRVYIVVVDGTDVRRTGLTLSKRAWLAGQGYIKVSKAGRCLPRTIIDDAVFQPNRIDYCTPPICEPPLQSRKPSPELLGDPRFALNTRIAVPDLTPDEEATYEKLVQTAKENAAADSGAVRAKYERGRVDELVAKGVARDVAEATIEQALDGGVLHSDFILYCKDGSAVTVGEILSDRDRWNLSDFADPIEPDYHGDRRVARAYLLGPGRPRIHSFAHGGATYVLSHADVTIRLTAGERSEHMAQIAGHLNKRGEFYCRGKSLVTVDENAKMRIPSTYEVLKVLDRNFRLEKVTVSGQVTNVDAKKEQAEMLMNAYYSDFPRLKAVLTAPTLDPLTGRIICTPGYDRDSGIFLATNSGGPMIPEAPTIDEVRDALALLWAPVHLFPFEQPVDDSVMLTAMVTAVLRPLLPTAPAFAFDAPVQGSGKTLLMAVVCTLAGEDPSVSPAGDLKNDEEMRKRLFSMLLGGQSAILIDNIIGEFDSPSLAALLTSEKYTDRVLQESRTEAVQTNALVLLSGNNLVLKGDLPRRVLRCRIDPRTELPHQREFDFNPVQIVREHRGEMVVAVLSIVKAFLAHKANNRVGVGRMASFEVWDDVIRQAVCWLAELQTKELLPNGLMPGDQHFPRLVDPMKAINDAVLLDPTRSTLNRLTCAWENTIGVGTGRATTLTVKELIAKASLVRGTINRSASTAADYEGDHLHDILVEIAGNSIHDQVNPRSLGKKLSSYVGQISNGLRLQTGDRRSGSATYWLERLPATRGFGGFGGSKSLVTQTTSSSGSIKENKLTKPSKPTKRPETATID